MAIILRTTQFVRYFVLHVEKLSVCYNHTYMYLESKQFDNLLLLKWYFIALPFTRQTLGQQY